VFYDTWLKTYNLPELVTGPVPLTQQQGSAAILAGFAAAHQK
jgi:hypothetical protein